MFTNSDFKLAFGLTIVGSIESNILGNLSSKVKKLLTRKGNVKTIFKLQYFNLSLNNDSDDSKGIKVSSKVSL